MTMMVQEDIHLSSVSTFRGHDYVVSVTVQNKTLTVEVEDRVSADQWRGTFDAAYVEELTFKTGNFKHFPTFISMVETALTKSSESVSLDLLTYSDLETLRNRTDSKRPFSTVAAGKNGVLTTKRYLILTYTVEFDRIHYPLPLPYQGKPDPAALQEVIRQLRAENRKLKEQIGTDFQKADLLKWQAECTELHRQKELLEEQLRQYGRQLKSIQPTSTTNEIQLLKSMIKSLEEDVKEQKTKYQKSSQKRNEEYREVADENEQLKMAERNLKGKVKKLTDELAAMRRRQLADMRGAGRLPTQTKSSGGGGGGGGGGHWSDSEERARSRNRSSSFDRRSGRSATRSLSGERAPCRMTSRDSRPLPPVRQRSLSRDRSDRSSSVERKVINRPSPANSRSSERASMSPSTSFRRFNPTAYVHDRNQRRRDSSIQKKRPPAHPCTRRVHPLRPGLSKNRSNGSLNRLLCSDSELSEFSDAESTGQQRPKDSTNKYSYSSTPETSYQGTTRIKNTIMTPSPSPDAQKKSLKPPARGTRRLLASKENIAPADWGHGGGHGERSLAMSEIDARLRSLQDFMASNLV